MLVHEELWLMNQCPLRKLIGCYILYIVLRARSIHKAFLLVCLLINPQHTRTGSKFRYARICWQVDGTVDKCIRQLDFSLCVYAFFFPVLSVPPNPWVQCNWSCWMSDPVIIPLITQCALPSRCRGPGAEKLRPGTTANIEHAPRQINKSGHIYHLFTSILCWTGIIYSRRCCGSGVTYFCI